MQRDQQTHTIATRAAHWVNAAVVMLLLWTGFSMFAMDRDFAWIVRMFPADFWNTIHFAGTKRQLFPWHVYVGAFFALNGIAYVASLLATGAWKRLVPAGKRWVHDAARPLDYSVPQRIAYTSALLGAAAMVVTGAALWFKHQIPWLLRALGGEHIVLPLHVVLATALLGFIMIHVSQVIADGATTFRSMTVGQAFADDSSGIRTRRTPQYR